MMLGPLVSSVMECQLKHHKAACIELFQETEHFEPTFTEAHEKSNMICKVMSLKSRIKTHSLLEEIKISSTEVYQDFESDIMEGI